MAHQAPKIMQFSFVVADLDRAIWHWSKTLAVGPFFVLQHVPYKSCYYLDESTDIDMSVAMAYRGDVQIELVQQHNNAPSIFTEYLRERGEGLQHVASVSEDLPADLAWFARHGKHPVQQGEADNGTKFAYLDTDLIPGTMLELVSLPEEVRSAFEFMKKKAAEWQPDDAPKYGG